MAGYTPGEQPGDIPTIKLNTNENPYPPSPHVAEAVVRAMSDGRLRRYPDRQGAAFCRIAATVLSVAPDWLLPGNGSDDILTILTRAFVPEGGLIVSPTPSYLLYRTLADIQGARFEAVPYAADWSLPERWPFPKAHLTFIANPNSPSGTCVPVSQLRALADSLDGPLVIDEAYADFADSNALALAQEPNVIVTRSLSKAYSLAGARFGFAVCQPELVRELTKVKDSYNCDMLSLAAAAAAMEDQPYFQQTRSGILATRTRLRAALARLGFEVTPSQANFLWCRHNYWPLRAIYEDLKRRAILIRYMNYDGYGDGLRISVGTDDEVDRLLAELRPLIKESGWGGPAKSSV